MASISHFKNSLPGLLGPGDELTKQPRHADHLWPLWKQREAGLREQTSSFESLCDSLERDSHSPDRNTPKQVLSHCPWGWFAIYDPDTTKAAV